MISPGFIEGFIQRTFIHKLQIYLLTYQPCQTRRADSTTIFHSLRSSVELLQLLTANVFVFSFTQPHHLFQGLPLALAPSYILSRAFFELWSSLILTSSENIVSFSNCSSSPPVLHLCWSTNWLKQFSTASCFAPNGQVSKPYMRIGGRCWSFVDRETSELLNKAVDA